MTDLTLADIVQLLAQSDHRIHVVDEGGFDGYSYRLQGPSWDVSATFEQLLRDGWIEPATIGRGYVLSDRGRVAYLRSTDELGDGALCLATQEGT
jgi:hypothetical protein